MEVSVIKKSGCFMNAKIEEGYQYWWLEVNLVMYNGPLFLLP